MIAFAILHATGRGDPSGDGRLVSINIGADEWFSRKPIVSGPDFLRRLWSLLHMHGRCDARVGRRSLGGAAGTSPRVNFRMTAELQARAQARAEREGKTVSEIARDALEQYVRRS
jgi:hypothetical protein